MRQNFLHIQAEQMRQGRKKMNIREFEPLTIIGRGAFGEVRVCRQISTGDIVAIKKMRKEDMLNKNQLMHVRTEKEIMTASNPWIVKLKYSFQDDYYLYLVMEFLPGGDLMNLLMKKEVLTEDEARFYTAEMILAVDSVHKLNCIHRDLKPDNILIDKNGHCKLADFGCSIKLKNNQPDLFSKTEGNMYFFPPEFVDGKSKKQFGYKPVDIWAFGVSIYTCIFKSLPFLPENRENVVELFKEIREAKFDYNKNGVKISKDMEILLGHILDKDPNKRFTAKDIVDYPWLKSN